MFLKRLIFSSMLLSLVACGSRDNKKDANEAVAVSGIAPDTVVTDPNVQSPVASSQPRTTNAGRSLAALDLSPGNYEQRGKSAVKLVIDSALRVTTNATVPFVPQSGSRLTPNFPHRLQLSADGTYYQTTGTFNRSANDVDDVELRIVPNATSSELDVTLVVNVRASDSVNYPVTGNPLVPQMNEDDFLWCFGKIFKPKPPLPPPPPPPPPTCTPVPQPPPPPCPPSSCVCCCCCPPCGDKCDKDGCDSNKPEPARKVSFPYVFIRV
jgi:hypothetical protein